MKLKKPRDMGGRGKEGTAGLHELCGIAMACRCSCCRGVLKAARSFSFIPFLIATVEAGGLSRKDNVVLRGGGGSLCSGRASREKFHKINTFFFLAYGILYAANFILTLIFRGEVGSIDILDCMVLHIMVCARKPCLHRNGAKSREALFPLFLHSTFCWLVQATANLFSLDISVV